METVNARKKFFSENILSTHKRELWMHVKNLQIKACKVEVVGSPHHKGQFY